MRSRITILGGVLLFSLMFAAPAHAGPWSAFVAWLSELDPKTRGIGVEWTIWCPKSDVARTAAGVPGSLWCARDPLDKSPAPLTHTFKVSAALMFGALNENGDTVFVAPVLGVYERDLSQGFGKLGDYLSLSAGGGLGEIYVGGTLSDGGSVMRPLVHARVTVEIRKIHLAIRPEINWIPNGFPAGTFAPGAPATGHEFPWGISFIFLPK